LLARLEQRETIRAGDKTTARKRLARRLGALPGTLENFARNRIKRVDGYLRARIEALLVLEIQQEIATLTHELDTLRQTGRCPSGAEMAAIEAALSTARQLMKGR
jgi:hypothetical protein